VEIYNSEFSNYFTFQAFGNGAPDIFTSIASVISAKTARADLAISGLLGGGIFVTTCVIASIAVAGPFLLMRRPILRDIGFYLVTNFDWLKYF
jgi:sodium/potassium/calcium exchanger 6